MAGQAAAARARLLRERTHAHAHARLLLCVRALRNKFHRACRNRKPLPAAAAISAAAPAGGERGVRRRCDAATVRACGGRHDTDGASSELAASASSSIITGIRLRLPLHPLERGAQILSRLQLD